MAARSPRAQAMVNLFAAHRELSVLELREFQRTMVTAGVWLACGLLTTLSAWLAANALIVVVLRDEPLGALGAITGVNAIAALVALRRVRRLVRRPFFALTRQEVARDAHTFLQAMP